MALSSGTVTLIVQDGITDTSSPEHGIYVEDGQVANTMIYNSNLISGT
jgi:hypothetical protein